jgi:hypothetical protein
VNEFRKERARSSQYNGCAHRDVGLNRSTLSRVMLSAAIQTYSRLRGCRKVTSMLSNSMSHDMILMCFHAVVRTKIHDSYD